MTSMTLPIIFIGAADLGVAMSRETYLQLHHLDGLVIGNISIICLGLTMENYQHSCDTTSKCV